MTTKWVGDNQSFVKCSLSNKLDDDSEDHMANIQGKKRLTNALKKETAILQSLNMTKLLEMVQGPNHHTNMWKNNNHFD